MSLRWADNTEFLTFDEARFMTLYQLQLDTQKYM